MADRILPGLCGSCRWRQAVRSRRGAVFVLCRRAREDPRYPRYPVVPVVQCSGHEVGAAPPGGPENADQAR